jgi:phage terminase large subunit-like protein
MLIKTTRPIASSPRSITAATLVEAILRNVDHSFAYQAVHASRDKLIRAELIAALYEQHRVHHASTFGALEDQMCDNVPMGSKSPDRIDALVWALTELSDYGEQEILYEDSQLRAISPELDAFTDWLSRF